MRKRKRRRTKLLVGMLMLALGAGLLWRWVVAGPPVGHGGEEINAADRQRLENILRQKNPEAQR